MGVQFFQDSAAGVVTNLTDSNFEDGRAKTEILIVLFYMLVINLK